MEGIVIGMGPKSCLDLSAFASRLLLLIFAVAINFDAPGGISVLPPPAAAAAAAEFAKEFEGWSSEV